jgi:RecA-family ATPase
MAATTINPAAITDEELRQQINDAAKPWEPPTLELADSLPEPPDWLVSGLIERGTVTVFAGDTGAVKSMLNLDLAAALVRGRPWLGRQVDRARVVYVDNEQPANVVSRRAWALGLRPEDGEDLRYYNRQAVRLDNPKSTALLKRLLGPEGYEVLIVDTLLASQRGEVNSNTDVARLLDAVRELAENTGSTVIILHHQRKPGEDGGADTSLATMGARYIVGGADNLITVSKRDDLAEVEDPEDRAPIMERAGHPGPRSAGRPRAGLDRARAQAGRLREARLLQAWRGRTAGRRGVLMISQPPIGMADG